MRTALILAASVAFLAACSTNPTLPTEVRIPVMVQCVKEVPPLPRAYTDAELKILSDGDLVLGLAQDRLTWRAHSGELRALLESCK